MFVNTGFKFLSTEEPNFQSEDILHTKADFIYLYFWLGKEGGQKKEEETSVTTTLTCPLGGSRWS